MADQLRDDDVQSSNRLLHLLDEQQDQSARQGSNLESTTTPDIVLRRLLSLNSTHSTASSFALSKRLMVGESSPFRKIGFGQCGLIFEQPGRGFVVKVARRYFEDALWNDLVCHVRVHKSFADFSPQCRITNVYRYTSKNDTRWWSDKQHLFGGESRADFSLPQMALVTQRVLPLPKTARAALIELFCPQNLQDAALKNPVNRDCVARVYLGRRSDPRTKTSPNFTLRNFNLFLDYMLTVQLPVHDYASAIGEALAVIHWAANVDGFDIEYILGSEGDAVYHSSPCISSVPSTASVESATPHTSLDNIATVSFAPRSTRLWVIDFNLCSRFDPDQIIKDGMADQLLEQLTHAFFENDPYYPLPLMETSLEQDLWLHFKDAYLGKARTIVGEGPLRELPGEFVERCVYRERTMLEVGKGHGFREHKG